MNGRILVVDDDRVSRESTTAHLNRAGFTAASAENASVALRHLAERPWDVVVTDIRMPGMDGLELLQAVRKEHPGAEVLLMTAYGTVETAVEAMKAGALDYLTKPFRFAELEIRLRRACEAQAQRRKVQHLEGLLDPSLSDGLVGRSPAMREVRERIVLYARHNAPVLVTGATGTGKELVSRALHDASPRRAAPFMPVACGAIPEELAESYFFGHEKGAFTGADRRRKGCFEMADGGTLLLDDVDDLPLRIQVKLLRVLQESVILRVGGDTPITVDVRIVATTKVDLAEEVKVKRFREDLYYRLRGLQIVLPSLAVRGDDVLLLADHFLKQLALERGGPPAILGPGTGAVLRSAPWPGGVRELRRTMEAAEILSGGRDILPEHLPPSLAASCTDPGVFVLHLENRTHVDLVAELGRFEREILQWALNLAGGNQTRAAEVLGLARSTLQSRIQRR